MKVLVLSPYHDGSHQAWADGFRAHSSLEVTLMTLPGRFWKWRMHGGAVTLARRFMAADEQPDVILATSMLDLTTFLSLTRQRTADIPVCLYMHENQLTYPLPVDPTSGPMRRQLGERDRHYAFINFASMLSAQMILFNSKFHQESWFEELPRFLNHFPEYRELNSIKALQARSHVLSVGIDFQRLGDKPHLDQDLNLPPLILWNHRWEYDKNPGAFFRALYTLQKEGLPFRLALCGQQFGQQPAEFEEALTRLADQIVHAGHAKNEAYRRWLWQANITVSTAYHEFFGISILEAIGCHTFPILPYRLSYPELIPEPYHLRCLYQNEGGLLQRLRWALTHRQETARLASSLALSARRYNWSEVAPQYDERLRHLRK